MYNNIYRDNEYISLLKNVIYKEYNISAINIMTAKRGYYGETWRLETSDKIYFVKLDYFPRHQKKFRNSLSVVEYLCNSGINFISKIVKTCDGELYALVNSAVMGVFEWINGENLENDATKTPEYQMLCKIYPLTKQGFDIPTIEFSDEMAVLFYNKWDRLKMISSNESRYVCEILEQRSKMLSHCALRLSHFASLCKSDISHFYITHGDAGGNFFVGNGRNYIVDWDEVMYAPLERDAWVMCCHDWARKLFNDILSQNNIPYELHSERLAFYCYHMFFLYLGEFLEDFTVHGKSKEIEEYFDGFIIERIKYADTI